VLEWYQDQSELEFWNILGFSNDDIVARGPKRLAEHTPVDDKYPWYDAQELFEQYENAHTDEKIDDSIFSGRFPNILGATTYEPPFQQTFSLSRAITNAEIPAPSENLPLWRGYPDDPKSEWSQITISGWSQLFNRLVGLYYWWFGPPFFKSSDTLKPAPMSIANPSATNTRFVVSTRHEPLRAKDLARKLVYPDMLLVSDLPIYPSQRHFLSNGYAHNVLTTLSKTFDTGDYFTSNSPGPQFTINEELSLSRFHLQLINPDGSIPTNLSGSIFVRLRFTIPPPPEPTPIAEQQQQQDGGSSQAGQDDAGSN